MVKIISDSTCDLSEELVKRYDITILPLHILLGDEEYLDGVNITPQEIFDWSDEHKTTPKTSAPSAEQAVELLKPYVEKGQEVICFAIASGMSSSMNVMRLAAEELNAENLVTVIDSANLSTGIGLLVIEAAIMAKEGKTSEEIITKIEELKPLVRASFVVDTLTYLYRGGRCSGLAALAGGALKLHPQIIVVDGAMKPAKKYRGNMLHVTLDYVKDMEKAMLNSHKDRVFITHSGSDPKVVQEVYDYLEGLHYFDEICITRAGGVVSSHCGYGTLGVLYIANE